MHTPPQMWRRRRLQLRCRQQQQLDTCRARRRRGSTATPSNLLFPIIRCQHPLHSCVPVQFSSLLMHWQHTLPSSSSSWLHFSNINLHTCRRHLTFFPAGQSPHSCLSSLHSLPLGAPFSQCLLPGSSSWILDDWVASFRVLPMCQVQPGPAPIGACTQQQA